MLRTTLTLPVLVVVLMLGVPVGAVGLAFVVEIVELFTSPFVGWCAQLSLLHSLSLLSVGGFLAASRITL